MHRPTALTAVVSLLLAALLSTAAPAGAAGTGDIELVPAPRDGQAQTAFTVLPDEQSITFSLVNLVDEPRVVRLYAASASSSDGGGVSVGVSGSAGWLDLSQQEITLAAEESRVVTAAVDRSGLQDDAPTTGAVVLEALQGAVTVRVATLVTVEPADQTPVPGWTVGLAVASIALVVVALVVGLVVGRRRRGVDEPATTSEPLPAR